MTDTRSPDMNPIRQPRPTPSDDGLDADVAAFHGALLELKRVYHFRDRDRICCYDISVTQCWALEALGRLGPLTLNQLAAELYLEKSTTSRVVDALERKGYVQRSPHPNDGRAVIITLLPAGAGLYEQIEGEIMAQERSLLGAFDPQVRRSLVTLIGRLSEVAAAGVVSEGGRCCTVGA